jgi:hypothetical protein
MAQSKVSTLEGNELADDYVRTHIPKGRWADTWDLFKSSFSKLVIINVLVLLFFIPTIGIVYFRSAYVSQLGLIYPFSANGGIYPLTPSTVGLPEQIILSADLLFYSLVIASMLIASVGLAGAAYSIRKLIQTHGQFTFKGFFHGVKVCYLNTVVVAVVFATFYFASVVISDWAALAIANGASAGGPITAKVCIIIATVIVGVCLAWIWAVGVSYRVKPKYLLKNSFVLLFFTILQTILMLAFALIPVWIFLIGTTSQIMMIIAYVIFIFIGFSFILLCWFAYTQWVFDMFITPAVKTEKEAARAKMTPKQLEQEKEDEEKQVARELLAAGKSELIGRPVKPVDSDKISVPEIGITFNRGDIKRAADDRKAMENEVKEYYEAHKNEGRYAEYNKLFAEREKALQSPDNKKGKKNRVSSDNLLRK